MISLEEILAAHQSLIVEFGGASGVRDEGLLKSAIHRPYSGFGDTPFYQTPEEKASAVLESIVVNHPFIDGNKRTGFVIAVLLLKLEGKDLHFDEQEGYDFVVTVASGALD